jgi:hypothetical protein
MSAPAPTVRPTRRQGWTDPRADGLPNRRVLWAFPALLAVLFVVAVLAGVSGSSTGNWRHVLSPGHDSHLIAGEPRSIRSDEWLVQGSWLVSEKAQGFDPENDVFPGGADATVMNDTPTWDWSTVFRPHLWGSLVLDLGRGMAWRWWLPAGVLMGAVYVFVVSVLPRRPVLGAVLALATFFQPYVQWWYLPVLTLAVIFAFLAMTAAWWGLRAADRRSRWVPAAVAGYGAVTMAMSIYVPFILDAAYVVAAFTAGAALSAWRSERVPGREVLRRLLPLVISGGVAGVVMVVWALTRWDTVQAIVGTVYPGQRLYPTGTLGSDYLVSLFSGPFQRSLQVAIWDGLGSNQSSGSSPFLGSFFLLVPLLWFAVRRWRRGAGLDWPVLALVALHVFLLAFMFVPGWDVVAHLLLVDRAHPLRVKLAFVMTAVVAVVLLAQRHDEDRGRGPWIVAVVSGLLAAGSGAWVWSRLSDLGSPVVPSQIAIVLTAAFAVAVLLWSRGLMVSGSLVALGCTLVVGAGVHPLYRGVFDAATDTQAGREMLRLHEAEPDARWVGVGNWIAMATVFEGAVPGYSGVQTYPSREMWAQIDPTGASEDAWNRLAHIHWVAGSGDPAPRNPGTDVVELTFDSCGDFAQEHVTFVLNSGAPLHQRCLQTISSYREGPVPEQVYRVLPR